MSDLNPGEELRNLLQQIYPQSGISFISSMDSDLKADSELKNLFYRSSMNYLVRRLINTAEYFYRADGPAHYQASLQDYLLYYTRYKEPQRRKLVRILARCLDARHDETLSNNVKNEVRQESQRRGHSCWTCGKIIDYDGQGSWSYATIDHVWPRAMGGLNDTDNLRIACKSCNNHYKGDTIDDSDFHYEAISLINTTFDEYITNRNRRFELAVFARTGFACAACGKDAFRAGALEIGRIDNRDSWHFLNLAGYCDRCAKDEGS